MTKTLVTSAFHRGDQVVLATGTYEGTLGVFLQLRPDANWADISEQAGAIRCHPVAWLAHAPWTEGNNLSSEKKS
jgi:hypothetical protein